MTENEYLPFIRLYVEQLEQLELLDDAATGRAVKNILRFAQSNGAEESIETAITDRDEKLAFSLFKKGYRESASAYTRKVEGGRKGGQKTQEKNRQRRENAQPYLEKYGGPEPSPATVDGWEQKQGSLRNLKEP